MKKIFEILVCQRVTVTAILFLILLVVILPMFIFIDFAPSQYDAGGDISAVETGIILGWIFVILAWFILSYSYKTIIPYQSSSDFINTYEDGFEIIADANTFGQSKKIGLKNLKTAFACHAIFIGLLLVFLMILMLINPGLLVTLLENGIFQTAMGLVYLMFIIVSFNKVKKWLN